MIRPLKDRLPILALAVLTVLLAAGSLFAGPEERKGKIDFTVRLEPADLAPGGEGVLVVTSVIEHELHLYVDGPESVRFKPLPVKGVTYHVANVKKWTNWEVYEGAPGKVTWTKPIMRPIPGFPNAPPEPVWQEGHDFEIHVPVTLSAEVAADAEIGLVFDYSACDEATCYTRISGAQAVVALGSVAADPTGDPPGPVPAPALPKPAYGAFPQSDAASVTLEILDGPVAVVTFTPSFGYYIHGPDVMSPDVPLTVEPLEDAGITWGDWDFDEADEKLKSPYAVRVPFERDGAKQLRIRVGWQGCAESGTCEQPQQEVVVATWGSARVEPPPPLVDPDEEDGPNEENGTESPPTPPAPEVVELQPGEKGIVKPSETLPFPVILGDDLDKPRTDDDWREVGDAGVAQAGSEFEEKWKKYGILVLGIVFLFGVGLAFTPCVLPIIPLTISVIGGGNPDIKKSRLTLLLSVYVLGLTVTYGAAGAAAGFLGEAINLSAAFENPAVLWTIAIIFVAMAAGMMGFFELQPPAWMERMRGGAQKKSGTIIGSFLLGILAAVIASPCTGPFVVSMIAFAATKGPVLGFLLFSMLGLGMGAVFFAAGSLNLLARPGPWMIWVRYAFGVILFGFALYLLANSGQLDNVIVLFAVGFVVALVGWWAIARHLVRKEGERIEVARMRGAILAVCLIITTGAVAFLTRPVSGGPAGWIKLKDVAHLKQEVARAVKQKKPVVVKIGATWCTYCKAYDGVIADDAYLSENFKSMVRLKIDVEKDTRDDLRQAVGLPGGQPKMVFFDEAGRIRRAADIQQWHGEESDDELKKRVDFLYWRTSAKGTTESTRAEGSPAEAGGTER